MNRFEKKNIFKENKLDWLFLRKEELPFFPLPVFYKLWKSVKFISHLGKNSNM